jgi:CheY-like chemotaxis protein
VGDPNRLTQIINNLISNAIKFTDTGEVILSVDSEHNENNNIKLKFAVADTGIGISEDNIDKLFDNFTQLDTSYAKKNGGTGLGLAISKQLVEMMDGEIWLESNLGKGSTFYFTVSLSGGSSINGNIYLDEVSNKKVINSDLNILLVDDDTVNKLVISQMLQERSMKVDLASDGLEAINKIKKKKYDLILMDIQMAVMDGLEATKIIRKIEEKTQEYTPIVAITAYALKGDKDKFLSFGMDGYLSKPVDMDELFKTIDTVINTNNIFYILQGKDLAKQHSKDNRYKAMNLHSIGDIWNEIEKLKGVLELSDIKSIEAIAHKIKLLSKEIEVDKIKDIAFKIELSARRGDILEIRNLFIQLENYYETYRK